MQDETGIHREEIAGLPDGRWLVLFLLLYARDGDFRIDELAERLGGLGFGAVTPDELQKTMQQFKEEGLVKDSPHVPDGDLSGSGAVRKRFGLKVAGESYLQFWGDSLQQYGNELLTFYTCTGWPGCSHESGYDEYRQREGRDEAGTVFVLTSSGLRHMGLRPGSARANATGRGFLGYLQEEIFWKDALELVHEDNLPLLWFLVSLVMEEPGASESVEVRFRDAWGDWVLMDVCVLTTCSRLPQVTTQDFSS